MGSLLVCIEELVIATLVHCVVFLSVVWRMEGTRNRMKKKPVVFKSLAKRSSASFDVSVQWTQWFGRLANCTVKRAFA